MTRFNRMHPAQQAGILCNDPQFQKFAAIRSRFPETQFCASAAAQYLRDTCKIESRRELNTDTAAQSNFAALRTTFDAWAGRIAAPTR
jgi:hypothetical protein